MVSRPGMKTNLHQFGQYSYSIRLSSLSLGRLHLQQGLLNTRQGQHAPRIQVVESIWSARSEPLKRYYGSGNTINRIYKQSLLCAGLYSSSTSLRVFIFMKIIFIRENLHASSDGLLLGSSGLDQGRTISRVRW